MLSEVQLCLSSLTQHQEQEQKRVLDSQVSKIVHHHYLFFAQLLMITHIAGTVVEENKRVILHHADSCIVNVKESAKYGMENKNTRRRSETQDST